MNKVIIINIFVLIIVIALIEIILSIFFPLSITEKYTDEFGNKINPVAEIPSVLQKNITYFHIKNDFKVRVTSNKHGFRKVFNDDKNNNVILFLGDSFLFGHGVNDNETFVHIYCKQNNLNCINSSRPGSDTEIQIKILENFLKNTNKKIKKLYLFSLVKCDLSSYGNDLLFSREINNSDVTFQDLSFPKKIQSYLYRLELSKRFISQSLNYFKSTVSVCSSTEDIIKSIKFYNEKIIKLKNIISSKNIKLEIIFISPLDSAKNNIIMRELLENYIDFDKIHIFVDKFDISNYYKFDGHWNIKGNMLMNDLFNNKL